MEHSGFFEAVYDESIGEYDRVYLAEQFANYFKLFIGNGVFISPTNQLKVIPGIGLSVIVTEGWAFINGYWYHNDSNLTIPIISNPSSEGRIDSIVLRMTQVDRNIKAMSLIGTTAITRSDSVYDLKLAEVLVTSSAITISDSNISDTRPNEDVCGFVKGLVDVITTKDLFSQFEGIFNDWFETIKGQLSGDLAVRLQMEFTELNQNVENYYNQSAEMLLECQNIINNYVEKDFILVTNQELQFIDNNCIIEDERITINTLVDVYFTADTIDEAIRSSIYVDSTDGAVILTSGRTPISTIVATIRVRVR